MSTSKLASVIVSVVTAVLLMHGSVSAQDQSDQAFRELSRVLELGVASDELDLVITPSVVDQLTARQRNQLYEGHHRPASYTAPTPWYVPTLGVLGGLTMGVGALGVAAGPHAKDDPTPILLTGGALLTTSLFMYLSHVGRAKRERIAYNKALARLLGLAESTSLYIAPIILPSSTGTCMPGIGLSLGL